MPQNYYLPPNEGEEAPQRWLFFDTETVTTPTADGDELLTLDYGWCLLWIRGRPKQPEVLQWRRFMSPMELCTIAHSCAARKQRLMLVAHNLQFDAAVVGLLPNLTTLGYEVTHLVSEYGRQIYRLRGDETTVLCVDSYNWLPFSVQELGDRIELPKLPPPTSDAAADEQDAYCRRDVEIIYRSVRRWLDEVRDQHLGVFAVTLAGQAFNAYRHRFMRVPLLVDKDTARTQLARAAYYGGRTECFHLGALPPGEYTYLDVNSLYPSVMRGNRYPVWQMGYFTEQAADIYSDVAEPAACIANVELETREPLYPLRRNGQVCWPIGTFRTTLAGPELALAAERDHVRRIFTLTTYATDVLFTEYVEYFYQRRRACLDAGDMIGATINKLLLNTLSGKFGQRSPQWTKVALDTRHPFASWEEYNCDAGEWRRYRTINGVVYQEHDAAEGHLAIPAIAAFITSYARVALLHLIERAGWEHVYLTDTDSVLVDAVGARRLTDLYDRSALGKLKIVWQSSDVEIYGLKSYRHDRTLVAAGLRKDSEVLPDGSFSTRDFWGLTHNWSAGVREGVIVHHYVKSLSRGYAKGTVESTGRITPLELSG